MTDKAATLLKDLAATLKRHGVAVNRQRACDATEGCYAVAYWLDGGGIDLNIEDALDWLAELSE